MKYLWLMLIALLGTIHASVGKPTGNNANCGKRPDLTTSKRIVGGNESQQGSWPWQAAVLLNNIQWCAGSLINDYWVVTAAHCVLGPSMAVMDPKLLTVALGEHKLGVKESFEQIKNVQQIISHPHFNFSFDKNKLLFVDNDVALLKLSTPATFDTFVKPICLVPNGITFDWGTECYITGWGHTQFNGTQPDALREAKVELVSHEVCNGDLSYQGYINDVALCAGFEEGGVDACNYDSGGPLACKRGGRFYLTGIVSWGHECALPHKYGVYTNMMVLTSWVKNNI